MRKYAEQVTKAHLELKEKHKIEFTVRAHQVDHNLQLKATALGDMLIVIAQEHSIGLGLGLNTLIKSGVSWVLGRMTFKMKKWPTYLDKLDIETWITHIGVYKTVRKFSIKLRGEEIGVVYSLWSLFNLKTRRAEKMNSLSNISDLELTVVDGDSVLYVPKISVRGEVVQTKHLIVQYSDTDILGHMYSIRYLEHAMNTIPLKEITKGYPANISTNFLKEANVQEEVIISTYKEGMTYYVVLKDQFDQSLFIAEISI